jgi:hypothetical protein
MAVDPKTIVVRTGPVSNTKEKKIQGDSKLHAKRKPTSEWLKTIYKVDLISAEELKEIYDTVRFIGFDRELMLAELEEKSGSPRAALELIIGCALRGPQAMSMIKMTNGKTPIQMGIPASGKQGTEELSCQRITSATADLAAFYMKKLDTGKRLNVECPGWLQFPSAGSIKMPQNYRQMHYEFALKFSPVIGGVFNEQIYRQMVENAYLDENLHLFD